MNLELDHVFVLVEPEAKVADLLVSIGIEESFSRNHKGQGTSNRRFEFSNGMLELLWVRDTDEAISGPGRDLLLPERARNAIASPFGVILRRNDNSHTGIPFEGWKYQPDYFDPPWTFHVGINSSDLLEPLCIYAPFIEPCDRRIEKGTFQSISNVRIYVPVERISDVLAAAHKADRLSVVHGNQQLMEVTLDENQCGLSKDFRPEIPLVIHW